ncbi:MAG: leucine-rich repeat protein [Oscillospiraceae bacterium]
MKKLALLLFLPFLPTMLPFTVHADEAAIEPTSAPVVEYKYGLDEEGNAELYDFLLSDSFQGELTIPTEIEGHPVDYVGNACYMNAKGITSVVIPAAITDMGDSVFFGCTALDHFTVQEGNTYYSVNDGVLMADNNSFLVAYPAAKPNASYTIPAGVNELAPGAFGFAQNLKEIVIPDGVQFIDNWCFSYSMIEKASVAGTVYQIDDYAFAYCNSLHDVTLNAGIEKIYHAAFAYDKALTQITIPNTVTLIGQYAFCGTGLPCVTIPNSLEEISYCAFGYDDNMNPVSEFTIYGELYSMAEQYATATDEENGYQNQFTFVAVKDASIPYELGNGELLNGETQPLETTPKSQENQDDVIITTDEEGNTIEVAQTEEPTGKAGIFEKIGAGLFGNQKLQMILGIGGGVAVILAIILIIAFSKKPKNSTPKGNDDNED